MYGFQFIDVAVQTEVGQCRIPGGVKGYVLMYNVWTRKKQLSLFCFQLPRVTEPPNVAQYAFLGVRPISILLCKRECSKNEIYSVSNHKRSRRVRRLNFRIDIWTISVKFEHKLLIMSVVLELKACILHTLLLL